MYNIYIYKYTKNAHIYHIHIHPLVGATKCYQAHFLSEPFLSPPTLKGKKNTAALARFFAKRWAYSGISCHPKGLGSVLKKSPKGEETRSFMVRINKLCINRQNGYISIVCMYIYIYGTVYVNSYVVYRHTLCMFVNV